MQNISYSVRFIYLFCFYFFYDVYSQTGGSSFPSLEVKVTHLDNQDFQVEADGIRMHVNLAVYSKVNFCLYMPYFLERLFLYCLILVHLNFLSLDQIMLHDIIDSSQ